MPGPPRLPTAILKARGSWLAAKRSPTEPRAELGRPRCPPGLDPIAKRAWSKLIPRLDAMGILALIDEQALVRYVQMWARWREADRVLAKHGLTYDVEDCDGNVIPKARPEAAISTALAMQLLKLEREFGMTPAARARLATPASAKEQDGSQEDQARKFMLA